MRVGILDPHLSLLNLPNWLLCSKNREASHVNIDANITINNKTLITAGGAVSRKLSCILLVPPEPSRFYENYALLASLQLAYTLFVSLHGLVLKLGHATR
jgi:hypothetical protein